MLDDIFTTVGMHPTRCNNFIEGEEIDGNKITGDELLQKMKDLITQNPSKIVAIGECGLGKI